jgi:soluble lytic murein transglycosylase
MENVLVYRARFEGSSVVAGKSDERVVTKDASAAPRAVATPASFVGRD